MATVISKNEFVEFDGVGKVDLDKLFVDIYMGAHSKLTRVSLDKLFVKTGVKNGIVQTRPIKSYADFVKQLKNDNIYTSKNARQSIKFGLSKDPKVKIKGVHVPETYDSHTINKQNATEQEKVPYGLKRNLSVKEATAADPISDKYYFIECNGKEGFVNPQHVYFYDKTNKKRLLSEYKGDISQLDGVQLYLDNGLKVSKIYTEKMYVFPNFNAHEVVDFNTMEKLTYQEQEKKNEDGSKSLTYQTSTEKIDKYFSEQEYVKREIEDEKHPGQTKEISLIKVKNFQLSPEGEYYCVVVDGFKKMVKKEDLVDANGKQIDDFRKMVGEVVQIKENGKIVAKSERLTYEQAHMAYSTIKTYQETDKEFDETTYLRTKDGEYIKEVDAVKPISYKLVTLQNASFDAYLVKTFDADGKEQYAIVSKDYFEKYGDKTKYKRENAVRIQKCDFESKDCAVVQTTSKGEKVEQCAIVKKIKFANTEIDKDAKDTAYQGVVAGYKNGAYKLTGTFHNGEFKELSTRGQRYEHSEESYLPDYANGLHQYQSLRTGDIKIVDGKLVGGPKYKIGKGIKKAYSTLFKAFGSSFGLLMVGGVLTMTIGGPFVVAAIVGATVAAIPAIPIANMVYGAVKNSQRTRFMDKAEYNQKKLQKELEKRMQKLYERQTSKDYVPYKQARFEDEYSKLVNDIIALSSSTTASCLKVENGVAQVTPENANAAKAYMKEFNAVAKELKSATKDADKSKKAFAKLDEKMKALEEEGKVIPKRFQKKFDKVKERYLTNKNNHEDLVERRESLLNYTGDPTELERHAERDRMLKVASMMRTAVYFKTFKDNPLVQEALYGEKGLTDSTDIETSVDLAKYVKIGVNLTSAERSKILGEELQKLTSEERKKLTKEDRESLLAERINQIREEKRSQLTEEQIFALIEKQGLTQMVMNDLMLDSKDKKLQKEFEECKTIQEKIAIIRKHNAEKSMKMLDNMEMDFKNGLMVDGMGVGLSDEDMSRTPEYARGYQWAKVKQAIELVHNGLYGIENPTIIIEPETKEPVENPKDEDSTKNPAKTKTARLNKVVITSENSVAQQLEDQESKYYKDLMRSLTRKGGKFQMSKEEAALAIFNFADKVNQAHASKRHAKDVFEKGSVDAYILATITRSMSKGATLDYHTGA